MSLCRSLRHLLLSSIRKSFRRFLDFIASNAEGSLQYGPSPARAATNASCACIGEMNCRDIHGQSYGSSMCRCSKMFANPSSVCIVYDSHSCHESDPAPSKRHGMVGLRLCAQSAYHGDISPSMTYDDESGGAQASSAHKRAHASNAFVMLLLVAASALRL